MPQILCFDAVVFRSTHLKISIAASIAMAKRVCYVVVSDTEEKRVILRSSGFRIILMFKLLMIY
jgi:hypothetical protein